MTTQVALDLRLINRSKLATATGLSQVTVVNFLNGRTAPYFDTAVIIARALGVSLEQLAEAHARVEAQPAFPGLFHDTCGHQSHHRHF